MTKPIIAVMRNNSLKSVQFDFLFPTIQMLKKY